MKVDLVSKRFQELDAQNASIRFERHEDGSNYVSGHDWQAWATSVLNLLQRAFGENSIHYVNFKKKYDKFMYYDSSLDAAYGIFLAAKADYDGGYLFNLESKVSGEILSDFVLLAKAAIRDGSKDVAAVLACAALEDALKKYAKLNSLNVDEKSMQEVVSALKSRGLVSGAQKTLLDTMPKIRDYAMHANWGKLSGADVNSVIGFVEQFLVSNF